MPPLTRRTTLSSTERKTFRDFAVCALYACATFQFIRLYTVRTTFYLSLSEYLSGHERLPFQERILPAILINMSRRLPHVPGFAPHVDGAFTSGNAPLSVLALASMFVAGYFTQRLYRAVSSSGILWFLVYPIFLFAMLWAYTMHLEANYAYPYDIPSVAFFSAGLYFIYTRHFWPLAAVILIGTFNRETTLFLIGIFMIDSISQRKSLRGYSLRNTFDMRLMPWGRVFGLALAWLAVRLVLMHIYSHNSHIEDHVRIRQNLRSLTPRLLPALLNMCGYLLPVVLLLHRSIRPQRFQNYLWIVPAWVGVMFYSGIILETRIYGELCPYVAVALVLIMERHVTRHSLQNTAPADIEQEDFRLAA